MAAVVNLMEIFLASQWRLRVVGACFLGEFGGIFEDTSVGVVVNRKFMLHIIAELLLLLS